MNPRLSSRILIFASMCYGVTVGLLAVLAPSALTTFAVVGAAVLGVLWVARSLFLNRPSS